MKKGSKIASWRITGVKVCGSCKNEKTLSEYPLVLRNDERVPYSWCKVCKQRKAKDVIKKYSINNREVIANYRIGSREKKRAHIHKHYRKVCKKCSESRIYLIEFHHKNRSEKKFNPLNGYSRSLKSIIEEIKKCIPLCCNCHREFHYFERNFKLTIEQYLNNEESDIRVI